MTLRFTKMQGCGNDYIYFAAQDNAALDLLSIPWGEVAPRLSDRHFGIGGDGVVLVLPSDVADLRMCIYNADGSEAEMCGNASRCIARLAFLRGWVDSDTFSLETKGGIRRLIRTADGLIRVDMGTSLGNPHVVLFVPEISDEMVHIDGPRIECDPQYPNRTNVEFAVVESPHRVRMRVWERGSGETLACGTGACATAMEAVRQSLCSYPVSVAMSGGELTIDRADDHILMTGPAEVVFDGTIDF